jgi:5-methylcytosine-specific restriction endonuclease McrA
VVSLVPASVAALARAQAGVVTRTQLTGAGLTRHEIRAQLEGCRWQTWGSHVVVLHNGELARRQLLWAVLLDAGPPAALGSHTALELAGFRSFAAEAATVHLLVERGAKVHRHPDVVVHESRRLRPEHHVRTAGLSRTATARSTLDAAAWQPWPRFACALLSAVVQQRLCTAAALEEALATVGRIRHKAHLRAVLGDIAGGSEAISEVDLVNLCRRFHLRQPDRQTRRRDMAGRLRYLDATWEVEGRGLLVLEVDGSHHLEVAHWEADMRRERGLVVSGARVLRATSIEVRLDQARVAADLRALGVPSCQK